VNSIVPVPFDTESSIASVKLLAAIVHALKDDVFQDGVDYGVIPGTNTKPVLLLPGMEKLMRALRLRPEYIARQTIVDFDKHLFYFQYECRLVEIDSGLAVASAIGSANSHEAKWRWRQAQRVCPSCGVAAIIEGKPEYGGGWVCFKKKDGCGAKFKADDTRITEQQVGRVENPDMADQLNTIDKIAQKRALASAIKGAANVSEMFTVDLDDQIVVTRPLTADQGNRLKAKWGKSHQLSADDLRAALGGPASSWKAGYDAADERIAAWVRDNRPAGEPDVVDADFADVTSDEMPL
jgi:hypothetical protein